MVNLANCLLVDEGDGEPGAMNWSHWSFLVWTLTSSRSRLAPDPPSLPTNKYMKGIKLILLAVYGAK